ncbi:unnamed protein product [marine sediment metagenome]|uniref:Uncharacterized protein n=1 Tax=marine sediment metagenome TaxID=412755 RepID=X1KRI7_9ZZZZ
MTWIKFAKDVNGNYIEQYLKDSRDNTSYKQFADRQLCQYTNDDKSNTRWDEDTQRASGGDSANG